IWFQVASRNGVRGQSPMASRSVFVEGLSVLETPCDMRLDLNGISIRSIDPASLL
ncbi:hypothetical protein BCR37DRAFT_381888, partial [Protomyces lactucae-debilis]